MRHPSFKDYMRAFAAETRRAREERGLSREKLALRTGIHENTVGALERGDRDLNCITQTRLLAALGCEGLEVGTDGVRFALASSPVQHRRTPLLAAPASAVVEAMGTYIRVRRTELGLSLEDAGRLAGMHRNSVWNFERGLVAPNGYSIFALFRAFGLTSARADILYRRSLSRPGIVRVPLH